MIILFIIVNTTYINNNKIIVRKVTIKLIEIDNLNNRIMGIIKIILILESI